MKTSLTVLTSLAALAATALVAPGADAVAPSVDRRARSYPLPDGFSPEGIAVRGRPVAFVGSLVDGDIYRIDLRTGRGRVVSQGPGTPTNGLKIDRFRRLWVSGGSGGDARVVNPRTGAIVRSFAFEGGFINDVVLQGGRAWFTDSEQAVLRSVAVRRPGRLSSGFATLPLGGQWEQVPDDFNANGIATTPDGKALLVVQSATGYLFRVNPRTGVAQRVRMGGAVLTNGDGLLTRGRTLFAVQNRSNQIAVVRLGREGRVGRLVRTIGSPAFDVPTTVAALRGRLYLPNARFGTEATPTTTYDVVRVRR